MANVEARVMFPISSVKRVSGRDRTSNYAPWSMKSRNLDNRFNRWGKAATQHREGASHPPLDPHFIIILP